MKTSLRPALALASLAALAAISCVALATPARASVNETISDYRVDLTVGANGSLHVHEVIGYDFGISFRHGIYRTIPDRAHYDDKYDRTWPIHNLRVTAIGASARTAVSHDGNNLKIRIGDSNATVTGAHVYTIDYDVSGAIEHFTAPFDHAELNWNAIGYEWGVLIGHATVRVIGPVGITRVTCFAGPTGSRLACQQGVRSGDTATFVQNALSPYTGLTVVVAFPTGAVAATGPILKERFSLARAFAVTPATGGVTGALLLVVIIGVGRVWWARGRDRRYIGQIPGLAPASGQQVADEPRPLFSDPAGPVEFAPPDHIRPGQVGTLLDEQANTLDVTATIVDLAVRKYLTIEELPQNHRWSAKDWQLTKQTPPAGDELKPYEQRLFTGLFRSGTVAKLSDLHDTFYTDLAAVENALYDDAVDNGWFSQRPDTVRSGWLGTALAIILAGAIATYFLAKYTHAALIGLPIVVGGIVLLAMRGTMPARTAAGSAMLARVLGFRRYLETAEAAQLTFEEHADVFARYLPFAVVFGVTDRWAKAFATLAARDPAASSALGFYSGPSGWNIAYFAASMSSFTTSVNGTIASRPSSSGGSGFGGGGFGGGGGGGGGGGSW